MHMRPLIHSPTHPHMVRHRLREVTRDLSRPDPAAAAAAAAAGGRYPGGGGGGGGAGGGDSAQLFLVFDFVVSGVGATRGRVTVRGVEGTALASMRVGSIVQGQASELGIARVLLP